jgi:rare lipoprotein A
VGDGTHWVHSRPVEWSQAPFPKKSFEVYVMRLVRFAVLAATVFVPVSLLGQAPTVGEKESGLAAVYTHRLNGHTTSSGEIYSPAKLTAAHKSLPYGSRIKVTNAKSHRSVVVKVNDRGPVQDGRILDLSPAAAHRIGVPSNSMRHVDLEVLSLGSGHTTKQHAHS